MNEAHSRPASRSRVCFNDARSGRPAVFALFTLACLITTTGCSGPLKPLSAELRERSATEGLALASRDGAMPFDQAPIDLPYTYRSAYASPSGVNFWVSDYRKFLRNAASPLPVHPCDQGDPEPFYDRALTTLRVTTSVPSKTPGQRRVEHRRLQSRHPGFRSGHPAQA